jgi:RNA ligase (TIGR02306 family)
MSTHAVDVVRIAEVEKHPNADSLGLVKVYGYTCAVRLGDFQAGDLVAYIPPDSVVPDNDAFAFLGGHRRIKVKRLRGVYSQGLIVKAPAGSQEGDDVAPVLGIEHYEPAVHANTLGVDAQAPSGFWPVYDVEPWRRYRHVLVHGESVRITEKIHGASARFLYLDDGMHVGSHRRWKQNLPTDMWWMALAQNPWIESFCRANPGILLYGEVYGQVQDLKYDTKPGEYRVATFDLFDGARWLGYEHPAWDGLSHGVRVPVLYDGPYDPATVEALAEGKSTVAKHLREGCVIRATPEREADHFGRVQLKIVGNGYLERA